MRNNKNIYIYINYVLCHKHFFGPFTSLFLAVTPIRFGNNVNAFQQKLNEKRINLLQKF